MTKTLKLERDEIDRLDAHREWVWSSVSADPPLDQTDPGTALHVVQALLDDGIRPDETWKLHSLGVVMGDALSKFLAASWVAVDDEWGRDAALRFGGPGDVLFPIAMIAKRVEADERVDVFDLVQRVCGRVLESSS